MNFELKSDMKAAKMNEYIVSFNATVLESTTIKRKWWELWKPKVVILEEERQRRFHMNLTQKEFDLLSYDKSHRGAAWSILYKALAGVSTDNVNSIQIEVGHSVPTPYIKTTEDEGI